MRKTIHGVAIMAASLSLASIVPPASAGAQAMPEPRDPTGFASGQDVRAQVMAMLADMKPGQGFTWRPLVSDGPRVAAIEIWKTPGRAAVHPTEAEYAVVLEGAGTLVSGGTLIAPEARQPGLVEGREIKGGTRRILGPGDVLLIPAGVPHWFGITGDRLVLLGTKIPAK